MASAQGLFANCIYRHGGFCLSATSSCPAISQMSSTLSSQPAKCSRWKMETLQQAVFLVKIMLNMPVHLNTALLQWYVYFYAQHFYAHGDVNIKVILVIMEECAFCADLYLCFLFSIWKANVSFPECALLFLHTVAGSNNSPLIAGLSFLFFLCIIFYVLQQQDGPCCGLHIRMQSVLHCLSSDLISISVQHWYRHERPKGEQKDGERSEKCSVVSLFKKYVTFSPLMPFRICFCSKKKINTLYIICTVYVPSVFAWLTGDGGHLLQHHLSVNVSPQLKLVITQGGSFLLPSKWVVLSPSCSLTTLFHHWGKKSLSAWLKM